MVMIRYGWHSLHRLGMRTLVLNGLIARLIHEYTQKLTNVATLQVIRLDLDCTRQLVSARPQIHQ